MTLIAVLTPSSQTNYENAKDPTMPLSIEDKLEIQELMARYILASDVHGPEGMRDIFTEDGRFIIEAMQVDVKGIDNIVNWLTEISKTVPPKLYHTSSNFVIDGDGDVATMTCISQAIQITDDGIKHFAFGNYDDTLVKNPTGWRLKDHKLNLLM